MVSLDVSCWVLSDQRRAPHIGRGMSTNGPLLKADDVIIVESKDYKEAKTKQALPYGMLTCRFYYCCLTL